MALATRLAAGATVAFAAIKKELAVAEAGTLTEALEAESVAQAACGATSDHKNAVDSFVAKQKPIFEGR
jgi:2-(1,2-epoxy-1,2-dihydrophenyl)acetyl-CoA isomerase